MSWSAHDNEEQITERFHDEEKIIKKAKQLAELIKTSKHFTIFTGAGISTSTGIPDFRGPTGVWTLSKLGKRSEIKSVSVLKALPSKTHMAIVKLQELGICKYLISQNVDGLHLRSGIDPKKISELHGNTNLEICEKCKKRYLRDFRCREAKGVTSHRTSRKCTEVGCGGFLNDSIINFGENLPEKAMNLGFEHSQKSDLCLVLGSSLTVTPAANMPKIVGKKCLEGNANLCIVNLQLTPLDKYCSIHVHAKCDQFIEFLMKELNIEIPPFLLTRRLKIKQVSKKKKLSFEGIDTDGTPVSFIKYLEYSGSWLNKPEVIEDDPFIVDINGDNFDCVLHFAGHYNEPPLKLFEKVDPKKLLTSKEIIFVLKYNPNTGIWKVKQENENDDLELLTKDIQELSVSKEKGCILTIGNKNKVLEKDSNEWICYVQPNKKDLIDKVVFQVGDRDYTVTEYPFETKSSLSLDKVNITVVWKENINKEPSSFEYPLQFKKDDHNSCFKISF